MGHGDVCYLYKSVCLKNVVVTLEQGAKKTQPEETQYLHISLIFSSLPASFFHRQSDIIAMLTLLAMFFSPG